MVMDRSEEWHVAPLCPHSGLLCLRRLGFTSGLEYRSGMRIQLSSLAPTRSTLAGVFGFMLVVGLFPQAASAQLIFGRLFSELTREPIAGAMVQMLNDQNELILVAQTAPDGRYELLAPGAGRYRIVVSRIGYEEAGSDFITLGPRQALEANLLLPPAPILLEGVTAEVEARSWRVEQPQVLWPYFERREFFGRLGLGRFVDREALEGWAGGIETIPEVQRLLMTMQGRGAGALGIACSQPAWFLDGFRLRGANINDFISVHQIEGIEVYRRATEIPAEFGGPDSECGVIAVWSRRR